MNDPVTLPMAFLAGGGIMGRQMRDHDWSNSPLGHPEQWPQSLRTAVSIMLNSGHPMFLTWGPEQIFLFNDAYRPILGAKVSWALAQPFEQLWADIWDVLSPAIERAWAGEATWFENQKLVMQRNGYAEETYFNYSYSPIRDETGAVAGMFCACTETTATVFTTRQLRETERALREANAALQVEREAVRAANRQLMAETEFLRQLFERAPGFIAVLRGPNHVFELVNAAYQQLIGYRDVHQKPARLALPEVEGQGFFELLDQVYRTGEAFVGKQNAIQLQRQPGAPFEERFVDFVYQPLTNAEGQITGVFCQGSDVTERVQAEQALRQITETLEEQIQARTRELQQAEDALRQAQKMEAVGRLTGGIAHDFNNLLMGIKGSLGLIEKRLAAGRSNEIGRFIALAMSSTDRAAALTHRLLAFSRRQPLDPRTVRINQLVASMEDLLRRTLGETVSLELRLMPELWPTLCDPNQLESAILNLAINARDAMPDGGCLILETSALTLDDVQAQAYEVKAGQYVCLQVIDSGVGMSSEVITHAFDPFFTTKPIGQGTGLGLSMVYGFVRQSGGAVRIDSQIGVGTRLSLLLPRSQQDVTADAHAPARPMETPLAESGKVVLVVEDESSVRLLIVETLREWGYRTLEAIDGGAGLIILQSNTPVDLLITDVGLPVVNGRLMAEAAREVRPNLPVLYMTGYAEAAAAAEGFLEPGMALITKPFEMDAFAARVHEMVNGRRENTLIQSDSPDECSAD
ncbi:ATP-binding protein [Pseudomonas duriflava]|nr:ATP-binding protein [Pseudomonas duriflava]